MPVSVQSDELQPGMRLFEPVLWRDMVMLPSGRLLTEEDVSSVRRRFPDLSIRIMDPVLDEAVEFEDDERNREIASSVKEKIVEAMSHVDQRYSKHASLKGVDFKAINNAIAEIMKYLAANPVSAVLLARSLGTKSYLTEHTGNVFYLSMVLGSAARAYVSSERQRQSNARDLQLSVTMDLTPLGFGAMFMDLAMLPFQDLFAADQPLTDEQWQSIREHPSVAAESLPGDFSAAARTIVRSHHENCCGTGYPGGISPEKLHVFARIVRIADAYETGTARHVHKQAKSPIRVLREMTVGAHRQFYDPELIKVFARLIQPFPIGAKVHLEDGRRAVVVRHDPANPFQPFGIIAFDAENRRLPESEMKKLLRLSPGDGLRIKSFQGEDLSYLYDPAWSGDELPASGRPKTLFETAYP
jgi:hypothetical protein